jgi:predicted dehydrogenase
MGAMDTTRFRPITHRRPRIGLLGCGVVASYGHLPAIAGEPGLELAAVFDPDRARAAAARERFAAAAAFSDEAAFFAADLDAVVVTSPAPAHHGNVLRAAARGLPVLCEKPLAMNEAEAAAMIAAMARAGQPLLTAFVYRASPPAREIHRLVRAGAIGRPRSLRLVYNWNAHGKYEDGAIRQRRHLRMLEGGSLVDCGVHYIDLARWWLGEDPQRWQGAGAWVEDYAAPDHQWLHLDFPGGAHAMIETSYSYGHTAAEPDRVFTWEIIGSDGVIRYDRERRLFDLRSAAGTTALAWDHEKNFPGTYADFARFLASGERGTLATAEEGLLATRIARAATDQATAGHVTAAAARA